MEGAQSHVAITLKVEGQGWSHTSLLTTTTDAGMREREIIRSSPDAPAGSSLHLYYRDSDGDEVIVKLDELVQHLHNLGDVLLPAPVGPLGTNKIRLQVMLLLMRYFDDNEGLAFNSSDRRWVSYNNMLYKFAFHAQSRLAGEAHPS